MQNKLERFSTFGLGLILIFSEVFLNENRNISIGFILIGCYFLLQSLFMGGKQRTVTHQTILQRVQPKNGKINTLIYSFKDLFEDERDVQPIIMQLQEWGYEIVDLKISGIGVPNGNTCTVCILYK